MALTNPDNPVFFPSEKQLNKKQVSEFLLNYYDHHAFVCRSRFYRVGTSGGAYEVDNHYPDLNAGLVLPALKLVTPDKSAIRTLRRFRWGAVGVYALAALVFVGGFWPGFWATVLATAFGVAFLAGYRARINALAADLANAEAPLSVAQRAVLEKLIECFDPERSGIPDDVKTVADATIYLSRLRSTLYQEVQEREGRHRVKLAEIQAAAQVAYAG
jgi:hypothetical protein